jgi:hypothetical protein
MSMKTIRRDVDVYAMLEEGVESLIQVGTMRPLTLSVARQLLADLDEEISQAEAHDEAQSTGSDRLEYRLAVA